MRSERRDEARRASPSGGAADRPRFFLFRRLPAIFAADCRHIFTKGYMTERIAKAHVACCTEPALSGNDASPSEVDVGPSFSIVFLGDFRRWLSTRFSGVNRTCREAYKPVVGCVAAAPGNSDASLAFVTTYSFLRPSSPACRRIFPKLSGTHIAQSDVTSVTSSLRLVDTSRRAVGLPPAVSSRHDVSMCLGLPTAKGLESHSARRSLRCPRYGG